MNNRFIAIDPSSTVTGWAVFEGRGLVSWGKIDTSKVDYAFRFQYIINELVHIIEIHRFEEIAIEDVKFAWAGKNRARNIAGLQSVFRSIHDWAKKYDIPMTPYNPRVWKEGVVGVYTAPKEVTKENVCFRFPNLPRDLTDHEYDAIGIGVFHGGLRFLESLAVGGK